VAFLFVHMINPWGAAWGRRQTEDNTDLNRNFHDYTKPLPENPQYDALRGSLHSPDLDQVRAAVRAYCDEHGDSAFTTALFQGQHVDPKGLGFGGTGPSWSNETMRQILDAHTGRARTVALVDIHTGLGPYGCGMLISTSAANSPSAALARQWYGHSLLVVREEPAKMPYDFSGDLCSMVETRLAPATVVPVALEFGTFEVKDLLQYQIDDCWLQNHGDLQSDKAREIRGRLKNYFHPATDDWFEMLCFRAHQVIRQAVGGLTTSPD